mmetsp:Transcript_12401/g.36520  ORF Transcript_12401/g.36520 Transcript_12401/m.36520 type:complete len:209 (+) Transcript_12401:262-888(+)
MDVLVEEGVDPADVPDSRQESYPLVLVHALVAAVIDRLQCVEEGRHAHCARRHHRSGQLVLGGGEFRLGASQVHRPLGASSVPRPLWEQCQEVLEEAERGGTARAPPQCIQYVGLGPCDFNWSITPAAQFADKGRVHLERFVDLDRDVKGRHGSQLVLLPAGARPNGGGVIRCDGRGEEPIQVVHGDRDGLGRELAKVDYLERPPTHF